MKCTISRIPPEGASFGTYLSALQSNTFKAVLAPLAVGMYLFGTPRLR